MLTEIAAVRSKNEFLEVLLRAKLLKYGVVQLHAAQTRQDHRRAQYQRRQSQQSGVNIVFTCSDFTFLFLFVRYHISAFSLVCHGLFSGGFSSG